METPEVFGEPKKNKQAPVFAGGPNQMRPNRDISLRCHKSLPLSTISSLTSMSVSL